MFQQLASVYPRIERPRVAEAAYNHALTKTTHDVLVTAATAQRAWLLSGGERYCPDLVTWLQEERWQAKIPSPTTTTPDEFGYYPGQFDRRNLSDSEREEAEAHAEWVRRYIEGIEEQP